MTFSIGINIYDDPKGLLEILESPGVYSFFDTFYVIDGAYKGRPDEPEYDAAIMEAIVKKYPKIHYVKMFGTTQIEKRNRYMELADENNDEFIMIVDSDEYLIIRPDEFNRQIKMMREKKDHHTFFVMIHNDYLDTSTRMPRIIKNPGQFRYKGNSDKTKISHGMLFAERGKGECIYVDVRIANQQRPREPPIGGIEIIHDKKNRTVERAVKDELWYCDNPNR